METAEVMSPDSRITVTIPFFVPSKQVHYSNVPLCFIKEDFFSLSQFWRVCTLNIKYNNVRKPNNARHYENRKMKGQLT